MFSRRQKSPNDPKKSYRIFAKHGRLARILLTTMFVLPVVTSLAAPSPGKGKAISGQCAACHGNLGKSVDTSFPNLAGQNYQYLVQTMEKFKKGERRNSIMQSIAKGLSKEQIDDLAAYYSDIRVGDCKGK